MTHKDDIEWRMVRSLNLRNQHHTVLRDDKLGVQLEKITNKTDGGFGIGKSMSYFFIDGDDREFLSSEEMVDAYNEKFKISDESPTQEVEYIRVVKKRGDKVIVAIIPNNNQNEQSNK